MATLVPQSNTVTIVDPFNWPATNRADLMSLQTLARDKDYLVGAVARVKTA